MDNTATKLTLDDLQAVSGQVLSRLRQMATLPEKGTVAGQAVASMFWEALGLGLRGPVNDIDVFVNVNMPRSMRGLEEFPAGTAPVGQTMLRKPQTQYADAGLAFDYDQVKFIALRATTCIRRTYQVGLVNYTMIYSPLLSLSDYGHGTEVSQGLVDGFDLNLVGVGINLETGNVVATQGFLDFLHTQQIRAQTCNTPAHTLLRLAKKAFSGEIEGALCDFASERKMLELAIFCQSEARDSFSFMRSMTTLEFGSGKYKALYEQFASHLPPITQIEVSNKSTPTPYIFHSLQVPEPSDPADRMLVDMAKSRRLDQPCAQFALVSHFPALYGLLHPERTSLSMEEVAVRSQGLARMGQTNGPERMRNLQTALGQGSPDIDVGDMNPDEVFVFFFGQTCALNPKRAEEAALAWDRLAPLERSVARALDLRADNVLALHEKPQEAWRILLAEQGMRVINAVVSARPLGCLGEDPAFNASKSAQLRQMFDWLEAMGQEGEAIWHKMLPLRIDTPSAAHVSYHFSSLVSSFAPEDQEEAATRIMRHVVPSWPQMGAGNEDLRAKALRQWIAAGQVAPLGVFESAPAHELTPCLDVICTAFKSEFSRHAHEGMAETLLSQVFSRLSPEHLMANQCHALRAILSMEMPGYFDELCQAYPDQAGLLQAKQALVSSLRQGPAVPVLPYSDDNGRWWNIANDAVLLSKLEQKLLQDTPNSLPSTRLRARI